MDGVRHPERLRRILFRFSSGGELDQLAARYGQYSEGRAGDKGVEPEGIAVATYGRRRYVFVGMERANLVAVYRVSDPRRPELVQAVPTGVGPEGLLLRRARRRGGGGLGCG